MSKTIFELVKTIQVHEPIYVLNKSSYRDAIEFKFKNDPISIEDPNDPITDLLERNKREDRVNYDNRFKINLERTIDNTYSDIRRDMLTWIKAMSPAKQPTNQNVYRWMVDLNNRPNDKLLNVLVEIYRYVQAQPVSERKRGTALAHNFMNILELIRCQK